MTAEEIMDAIKALAQSQGFYGRLLMDIHDNEEILDYLVEQNFKNVVEMIMFLEC